MKFCINILKAHFELVLKIELTERTKIKYLLENHYTRTKLQIKKNCFGKVF